MYCRTNLIKIVLKFQETLNQLVRGLVQSTLGLPNFGDTAKKFHQVDKRSAIDNLHDIREVREGKSCNRE